MAVFNSFHSLKPYILVRPKTILSYALVFIRACVRESVRASARRPEPIIFKEKENIEIDRDTSIGSAEGVA